MSLYTINGKPEEDKLIWNNHCRKMEELAAEIAKYDWFYEMSDDHGVWTRGFNHSQKILGMCKSIGSDAERLWNAHLTIHYGPQYGFCYR